jgi:ribonuclease P protein component
LGKTERLKSRKLIEVLFRSGKSISVYPLRLTYLNAPELSSALQAGFTVSSKTFKKATDRNRIKRLLRETYRKQKLLSLQPACQQTPLAIFIMYTGKEMPDYLLIDLRMKQLLEKLMVTMNTAIK